MMNKKAAVVIIASIIMAAFLNGSFANAGVHDFYFDDFTADYYLKKAEDGTSRLKVVETFTAMFPEYKQNKGLCRKIPYTNNDGMNRTIDHMKKSDIVVKRNGFSEPIYSIEEENEMYEVCTGTDDYVLGKQVYTFEYEFKNVILSYEYDNGKIINTTGGLNIAEKASQAAIKYLSEIEKDETGKIKWQELYWDTNGTGFPQKFNKLTARVHFENIDEWTGRASCYVGRQGSNNQSRCKVTKIDDGVMFVTEKLSSYENLTYDIELKNGSYVTPPPPDDHSSIIVATIIVFGLAVITIFSIKAYIKAAPRRSYYKGLFVKPEYEPPADYDLHVLAEVYMKHHANPSVATIIKMVTDGKIELIKGEKKLFTGYEWKIIINTTETLSENEEIILRILKGGSNVHAGEVITLKRHIGNSALESLGKRLDKHGQDCGYINGLFVDKKKTSSGAVLTMLLIMGSFYFIPVLGVMLVGSSSIINNLSEPFYSNGKHMVGFYESILTVLGSIVATIFINGFLRSNATDYLKRTEKGLRLSRQLEGLRLYIKMAEADRLKFLQSVPGADTSPEGIVKLYEKLLPYAVLFGLEKTWLKEMNNYCELNNLNTTTMNINVSDVMLMNSFIRAVPASTNFSSSGGSSGMGSSSSHSGGGGGGFSGGGGGGGGGGGR